MAIKFQKKPATSKTTKQVKNDKDDVVLSEEQNSENVDASSVTEVPEKGSADACTVSVDLGFTKNLGNYQSARFGVTLSVPCKHEEIDSVFEFASSWVDEKLSGMIED